MLWLEFGEQGLSSAKSFKFTGWKGALEQLCKEIAMWIGGTGGCSCSALVCRRCPSSFCTVNWTRHRESIASQAAHCEGFFCRASSCMAGIFDLTVDLIFHSCVLAPPGPWFGDLSILCTSTSPQVIKPYHGRTLLKQACSVFDVLCSGVY